MLNTKYEFLSTVGMLSSPIQFFLKHYGLVPSPMEENEVITFQEVYEMYREFCKKQGEKAVAQRNLNADLKRLGFERTRRKQGHVWFAKLKTPTDV